MSLKPVVAWDEPVRIALCPTCDGYELFCLQRFLNKQDQDDIQRLRAAGYVIITKPLNRSNHIQNCECAAERFNRPTPALVSAPRLGTRPILSLNRRVGAAV